MRRCGATATSRSEKSTGQRVAVADDGGAHAEAHAYCMRPPLSGGIPTNAYFDLIAREYHRLGIDPEPLVFALDRAASSAPLARSRA